jgi:hypothetical protein
LFADADFLPKFKTSVREIWTLASTAETVLATNRDPRGPSASDP